MGNLSTSYNNSRNARTRPKLSCFLAKYRAPRYFQVSGINTFTVAIKICTTYLASNNRKKRWFELIYSIRYKGVFELLDQHQREADKDDSQCRTAHSVRKPVSVSLDPPGCSGARCKNPERDPHSKYRWPSSHLQVLRFDISPPELVLATFILCFIFANQFFCGIPYRI